VFTTVEDGKITEAEWVVSRKGDPGLGPNGGRQADAAYHDPEYLVAHPPPTERVVPRAERLSRTDFIAITSVEMRKQRTPQFRRYIGIDYSGAELPTSRLARLRVFSALEGDEPVEQHTDAGDGAYAKDIRWNWTRKELAWWLLEQLQKTDSLIVGIDHGFSFPHSYFERYSHLNTWDEFLDDFQRHWPTDADYTRVDDILREGPPQRSGYPNEFRLTEKRAKGTQSVFKFVGQGTVGKSTHAGIPWLRFLRRHPDLAGRLHFWPFDGFDIPAGKSVITEVWPTLFRKMYPFAPGQTRDQHDAYVVARWLQETDRSGELAQYLQLMPGDAAIVSREGWILGVR
jgi:hypothetical protein